MAHVKLYSGNNSHRVEVSDLKDGDGAVVTDATVSVTIYESDGETEVTGVTWPVSLSHDSNGEYKGVVPHDAAIDAGSRYRILINASRGVDKGQWNGWVTAQVRGLSDS